MNNFGGCGILLFNGNLCYENDRHHNIIDKEISNKTKEVVVILEISNNGAKKEIRFLCDGKESKTENVTQYLKGDRLFAAISLVGKDQRIVTIPIDQLKTRTPEINDLVKEYQQQRFISNFVPQVFEYQRVLLQQHEVQIRAMMTKMKFDMMK